MRKAIPRLLIIVFFLVACGVDKNRLDEQLIQKDLEIQKLTSELERTNSQLNKLDELLEKVNLQKDALSELNNLIDSKNDKIGQLNLKVVELESKLNNKSSNYNSSSNLFVFDYSNGMIGMGESFNQNNTYNNLKIIGYDEIRSWKHDIIDLSGDNTPTLTIEVSGTLYDFKIIRINWNQDATAYEIAEEVCFFEELANTDVLFNSVLAEGLPPELLTWKDDKGKSFYYLIGDTGLSGMTFPYIIISELTTLEPWWED